MSFESLVKQKLKRLDEIPDNFVTKVDRHQRDVYNEILKLLDTFDREGGKIVLSEANIAKVEQIINRVKETFFSREYISALSDFAGEFDVQAEINDDLIKAGFNKVPNDQIFKAVLDVSKRNAIELFGESQIEGIFFQPLRDQLLTSVTNGATFADTIDSIRLITVGDQTTDGLIQSHAKTYARTSFAVADRNYTTTISQSFSIEFYRYSGSEIGSTRPFCESRHDKFYHKKEIESWGKLESWSGRMKGTNPQTIFTNLGGWNCRHSLVPVSVFAVPKDVVKRVISKGLYKPDEAVKKWLGMAA